MHYIGCFLQVTQEGATRDNMNGIEKVESNVAYVIHNIMQDLCWILKRTFSKCQLRNGDKIWKNVVTKAKTSLHDIVLRLFHIPDRMTHKMFLKTVYIQSRWKICQLRHGQLCNVTQLTLVRRNVFLKMTVEYN